MGVNGLTWIGNPNSKANRGKMPSPSMGLLNKYGPPGSSANSFNEILALYNEGKCSMWVDATIAASFISDPKQK